MKKICFIFCLFLIGISNVFASDKIEVKLDSCVDGDTAKFVLDNEVIKARFLAIDTPESVHPTKKVQVYGKEASEYTCNMLKNANAIEIEYDENSDKTDKYGRYLVWVFVDGSLLQDTLIKEGLAKVAYLYGDYKYTSVLKSDEEVAKTNNIKIWSINTTSEDITVENNSNNSNMVDKKDYESIAIIIAFTILLLVLYKNKLITKSQLKKQIKKISK